MFSRSSWLHLRIPFSYFLLPIYLFSVAVSPNLSEPRLFWVFIIVHLFLYPASNGFNSYFDKDEKSIGGLKNPPPVTKGLYYLSLAFDGLAIILALWKVSIPFALMVTVYGFVSKAYSHPSIRLKKYPVIGWITTGFFQGFFTFVMCYVGINNFPIENSMSAGVLFPATLTTLMLLGNYPMTQIYQHEEDAKRGDSTLSLKLGIKGTFYFTAIAFSVAIAGFSYYFILFFSVKYLIAFFIALSPVLVYFTIWYLMVLRDLSKANYTFTMWLSLLSATCFSAFFIYLFLESSQVLQAIMGGY